MRKLFGLLTSLLILLIATPAFARSINLSEAGIALWIFIIIGAAIILMQLIPAAILFFSFIGTSTGLALGRKKEDVVVGAIEEKVSC
jgi:hypothetical protein